MNIVASLSLVPAKMNHHPFAQPDPVLDHPSYPLFHDAPAYRYRANASADPMYTHPSFPDPVPSFAPPYDIPPDHLHPAPYSPAPKDYHPHHPFPDVHDRRAPPPTPVPSTAYHSEYPDDYAMSAISNSSSHAPIQHRHHHQNHHPFPDRLPRYPQNDIMRALPTHANHHFRDNNMSPYDDIHYLPNNDININNNNNTRPPPEIRMHAVDETLSRMKLHGNPMIGPSSDLPSFIRPVLEQYVHTPNRLAFGERSVIVMSSKVAQKSYGTEKRFLCPPPTAIMIGNSWWSDIARRNEDPKPCPPRVVVSISGEPLPQEGSIEWTSANGKSFDVNDAPAGTTYVGRCVGKQLFISDVDEKKKKVEALVKIMAPSTDDELERVIGIFSSRSIKVISKPSKKRQSAKNLELCINHGSTISLFHRLRSQTVSTKYLCVSGSGSSFRGSDGAPLMGLDQRVRTSTPSFIARTASWDPFIMYIVDVNKPAGVALDIPPPPPPQPDYPSPPPNAIPFTNNGSQIPIYYNQTVVLQCLTSGVVSPVLIIRKVDHQTTAVGGGLQEGAKGIADHYCSPSEVCGDPVSQLHKVAFEVYDPAMPPPETGTPGVTGAFLSCMGEKVNTYRPIDGRQWNTSQGTEPNSPILPGSPVSVPGAGGPSSDYFPHNNGSKTDSAPASPSASDFPPSNDGGRVMKKKRSTSSAGGAAKPVGKNRRRPSSAGSVSSRRGASSDGGPASGAQWQVDIGETSVWTIVGTDQVRYNFYVPPVLFDNQNAPQTGSFPIPSKPVTPFPGVVKYLPPDRAAEAPKTNCSQSRAMLAKPNPHISKMLTLYGENFNKADPVTIFFGSDPSPYMEVRCTEAIGCLPPESQQIVKRRPIVVVRSDGVVFPSNVMYP